MKKKIAALLLAVSLSTVSLSANAFLFLAPLLAYDGLFTALVGSVGLHAALATILFNQNDTANSTNQNATPSTTNPQYRIYLDPAKPIAGASGWTTAATPTTTPAQNPDAAPPSSASGSIQYLSLTTQKLFSTPAAACQDTMNYDKAQLGGTWQYQVVPPGGTSSTGWHNGSTTLQGCDVQRYMGTASGWQSYTSGTMSQSVSCPAGYTASGSSCNLSDATKVQKPADGVCNIARNGNTFTWDMNDPDCLTANGKSGPGIPQIASGGGQIQTTHKDGSTSTVTINADGTATIQVTTPGTDASGNPNTTVNTMTVGAPNVAGQLVNPTTNTGQTTNTYSGTGTGQSSTPNATGNMDCNGCAQDQTLQITNNKLDTANGKLDTLHKDMTDSSGNSYLQQMTNALACTDASTCSGQAAMDAQNNEGSQFTDLNNRQNGIGNAPLDQHGWSFGWAPQWPWTAEQCQPFVIQFPHYPAITLDWCDKIARVRTVLGWLIYMLTAFGLFNIATGNTGKEDKA